jgi:hypothetical protein
MSASMIIHQVPSVNGLECDFFMNRNSSTVKQKLSGSNDFAYELS